MDQLAHAIPVVAGICSRMPETGEPGADLAPVYLLSQRKTGDHLAGCWEFPGGKIRAGESPEHAIKREWMEELGVEVTRAQPWTFVYQEYPEKTVLLLFFQVEIQGEPSSQEGQEIQWVTLDQARTMELPRGDAKALSSITQPPTP